MSDLTDFLLARITETEAEAATWPEDGHWGLHSPGQMWMDPYGHPIYSPRGRVLAECEARRLIVGIHYGAHDCVEYIDRDDNRDCSTLRALVLSYADHPDCRPEWSEPLPRHLLLMDDD